MRFPSSKRALRTFAIILLGASGLVTGGLPAHTEQARASDDVVSAPPRYALLIGIDAYKAPIPPLDGCANDVALMRDVLIGRFGFVPSNVVTLVGGQATRAAILATFRAHLIENARRTPGATFVFHYSGHGSQVADVSGDESDGLDESLVPVDSSSTDGANDITDDELESLFGDLGRSTVNTTVIMDCCHSGTATRGERKARELLRPANRRSRGATEFGVRELLRPSEKYVLLSGCRPDERAYETFAGGRSNGAFTWQLVQALGRIDSGASYRSLMEEVASLVALENPNQHPQIEGALGRFVLGGALDREEPFVRISSVKEGVMTIDAGESLGIRPGAQLAVYAPEARRLSGPEQRLTLAEVSSVTAFSATATLPPSVSIPLTAKVKVVAPSLGTERLPVLIPAPASPADLAGILSTSALVQPLARDDSTPWIVAVRRGRRGEVFPDPRFVAPEGSGATEIPSADREVVYIAGHDNVPLFGFFVAADDSAAASKLARALEAFAAQRNLKAIENRVSAIGGGLRLSVVLVEIARDPDGKVRVTKEQQVLPERIDYEFTEGTYFRIQVENTSARDIYVTLFDVSTDGSITQILPPSGQSELLKAGAKITTALFATAGPPGFETFKALGTVRPADFSTLQQGVVTRGAGAVDNPLSILVRRATRGTRSAQASGANDPDSWTTAQIHFAIRP